MMDTESYTDLQQKQEEQFRLIMEEEFGDKQCNASKCVEGKRECSRKAVARVTHACGQASCLLCLNGVIDNTRVMAGDTICVWCLEPARDCWTIIPL